MKNKVIGFVGLGKLGLPVALSINSQCYAVCGTDLNPKIKDYLSGKEKYPHKEEGIEKLLEKNTIKWFDNLEDVLKYSDIIFVPVQTPHELKYEGITRLSYKREDFDYTYLKKAITNINFILYSNLKQKKVVNIISTVLPGTLKREILPRMSEYCQITYNPFFIAMGTVIHDFMNPEFVLLGGDDDKVMEEFYREFYKFGGPLEMVPICSMSIESAELCKVLYNCFAKGTKVSLLDGTEKEINELVGKGKIWIYGNYNGEVIPVQGEAVKGNQKKLIEIILDNNEVIRCSEDHLFLTKELNYCKAANLIVGQSLMPLYRKYSEEKDSDIGILNYEMYLTGDGEWKFTHRMFDNIIKAFKYNRVNRNLEICKKTKDHSIRHHIDGNRLNNDPENLAWMTWNDHNQYHRDFFSEIGKQLWKNAEWKKKCLCGLKKLWLDKEKMKPILEARSKNQSKVWSKLWQSQDFRDKQLANTENRISFWLNSLGICVLCNDKFATWKHIQNHGLTKSEYQKLLPKRGYFSEELRRKRADQMKERLKDASFIKKINDGKNSKEYKDKRSQLSKEQWKNKLTRKRLLDSFHTSSFKEAKVLSAKLAFKNSKKLQEASIYNLGLVNCPICHQKKANNFHMKTHGYFSYKEYLKTLNHKVKEIRKINQIEETYCMIVNHPCHNFALSAGIFVHNTFISTKIVFANTIGEICDLTPGANCDDIVNALTKAGDRIISPKYLIPGMSDGGSCHPRDNIALSWLAKDLDLSCNIFDWIMKAREHQTEYLAEIIERELKLSNFKNVILLGYSFKPETNITTGSPALLLESILKERFIDVVKYDPFIDDPLEIPYLEGVIFIGCKHDCFKDWKFFPGSTVIDPFRYIQQQDGCKVIRIGE